MIRLRGQNEVNDINNKIIFSPRPGFIRGKEKVPELEFPLIYGHKCPYCNNVIQALFKAQKTFSLWPYEETAILSQGEKNSGETLKIFPDNKTKLGKSCYKMDFSFAEGGSIKLTLVNHIMLYRTIVRRDFTGAGLWEEGYKCVCTHTGIFSLREDLLVKDWLLFSILDPNDKILGSEIKKYKLPSSLKDIIEEDNTNYRLVPAIGMAPSVILVDSNSLVYSAEYQVRPLIESYKNKEKV